MPRADEIFDQLSQSPFRSTFDLAWGYWQIPLREEDKEKTAFIAREGTFEFNSLPMGLCNMNEVLGDLNCKCAVIYIDDLIVYSADFKQHLDDLRHVFIRMREVNMKIKASKSLFCRAEVPYLGHVLTATGVRPDDRNTATI